MLILHYIQVTYVLIHIFYAKLLSRFSNSFSKELANSRYREDSNYCFTNYLKNKMQCETQLTSNTFSNNFLVMIIPTPPVPTLVTNTEKFIFIIFFCNKSERSTSLVDFLHAAGTNTSPRHCFHNF